MTLKPRKDFRSIQGDFIYRHHNEPRVQLCVPKEETFTITTIHGCKQRYLHKSGCAARKTYRWLMECDRELKFIRFLGRIHNVHFSERETFTGIHVVRGETDNNACSYQTWECVVWSMDQNWDSRSKERKARMGNREAQTRQCSTTERNLLSWSWWPRLQRKLAKKCGEKIENARKKL